MSAGGSMRPGRGCGRVGVRKATAGMLQASSNLGGQSCPGRLRGACSATNEGRKPASLPGALPQPAFAETGNGRHRERESAPPKRPTPQCVAALASGARRAMGETRANAGGQGAMGKEEEKNQPARVGFGMLVVGGLEPPTSAL